MDVRPHGRQGHLQILAYESFTVAYDPDFHKFSPGAQLESRALALFGDQGLTLEPTRVRDRRTSR